jgi:hypothetical protein
MTGPRILLIARSEAMAFALRRHFDPDHVICSTYRRQCGWRGITAIWAEQPHDEQERRALVEWAPTRFGPDGGPIVLVEQGALWDLDLPLRRRVTLGPGAQT